MNKKVLGRSIEERDPGINERTEFGHWECDLVIGQKTGDDEVLLTLSERMSREYWMTPFQLDRISGLKNVIIVLKFQSPLKPVIGIICCPQIFDIVIERIQDFFWRFSQHWREGQNEMGIDP